VGGIYLSHLAKSTVDAQVCALVPRSRYAASEHRGTFAAKGVNLAGAKLFVCYPHPKDAVAFEKAYTEEHLPMAGPILARILGFRNAILLHSAIKRAVKRERG